MTDLKCYIQGDIDMRKRLISCLIIVCCLLIPLEVLAVTMDNTGEAKEVPYGDSKLPSCYEGTEYIDCYLPYSLTCEEVGGYAASATAAGHMVTTGGGSAMPESIRQSYVSTSVMMEAPYNYAVRHGWILVGYSNPTNCQVTTEPDTQLNVVIDDNGNNYYMTAVQPFFFRHPQAGQNNFPANESGGFGEVVDVILTDGTCIHFICFDINAAQHTNGIDNSGAGAFDYVYSNTELKLSQYNNLFSTQNGNCLEIWMDHASGVQAFKEKYNIGNGEGQNRIAYYRMYNTFLKDAPKRASGVGTDVSFSYGDVTISSNSAENEEGSEGIIDEWGLTGMPEKSLLNIDGVDIQFVDDSSLNTKENYSVKSIRRDLEAIEISEFIDKLRVSVVFIGLLLVFYSVFLIFAAVFDRVNTFIEISAIHIITFGKIKRVDSDAAGESEGVISTAKLIKIISITLIVGLFLISGGVFLYMSKFIIWAMSLFES